jgi:hypothetical protein
MDGSREKEGSGVGISPVVVGDVWGEKAGVSAGGGETASCVGVGVGAAAGSYR